MRRSLARRPRARFDRRATPLGVAILVKTGRERSVMTGALGAVASF